jgi:hypothetical protein
MKLYCTVVLSDPSVKNFVISPFGIAELLNLALLKSDGKTNQEIADVIFLIFYVVSNLSLVLSTR